MALLVTHSERMRFTQDRRTRQLSGLASRVERPRNKRLDNGQLMCSDRRIATLSGTHIGPRLTKQGAPSLVGRVPRHVCMPMRSGMNRRVGECMATRTAMGV